MASTYQTVSYGSSGESVRRLQNALNKKGYGLSEDGIFGEKTRAAVRDYQKKNGLLLDGIAGDETWGHLMKSITPPAASTTGKQVLSGVSDETADALRRLEQGYTPSDEVTAAEAAWQSVEALRPAAYESDFASQLAALYDEIAQRPAFSYDPTQDEDYAHYAALYTRQGQRAMEDTLGKASALTGGYDSSYAQGSAEAAYLAYMKELGELMPELAENAGKRYDAASKALLERYELLQGQDKAAYQRWQDGEKAWQDEREAAMDAYNALRKQDYDAYETLLSHYLNRAKAEQSASNGSVANTGKAAAVRQESLSSTAADSLQRAMGNYLSAGNADAALSLAQQYRERMTPAQKKSFAALFQKYGAAVSL